MRAALRLKALTASRFFVILRRSVEGFAEDGVLRLSAALSYYSIFSIAPLLIVAVYIVGVFYGPDAAKGQLESQLENYIGTPAATAVQALVKSAHQPLRGGFALALGLAALMIGASGVFGQLKDSLNTIWEVQLKTTSVVRDFIHNRLLSFAMVLVIGFLLLTSLLLSAAVASLNTYLQGRFGVPAFVWTTANFVLSFAIVTTLFAMILKVLPDVQIAWRHVWLGAAVTAVLFETGKLGLAYYLGRESTLSSFGAAGSVVLLLLWVYYSSCILLFGAEFTRAYTQVMAEKIAPEPDAKPVTEEARAQSGLPSPSTKGTEPNPDSVVWRPGHSLSPREEAVLEHTTQHYNGNTPTSMKTVVAVTAAGVVAGALIGAVTNWGGKR
ncbi:membrane protein [Roseimicrobium gellanilyticum]|uniref:Membrane protein n=1 Tax=Roseimicrobium gellanilyticum TaxID=748857 RepID=A0A366HUF0_9BACT|nr:YihY/virulence factor BrkB family protein [Roseimicrobium gellanilyticum]RBP47902.1 membrane protein [Roseimicrobium gellanilyticum]